MTERGNEVERWPSRFAGETEEPSPVAPNPHDPIAVFAQACHNRVEVGQCGADCCGPHTFPEGFYERHKDKACVEPVEVISREMGQNVVTGDMLCVFLGRENRRCSIYNDRPHLCRLFGTLPDPLMQCPYLNTAGLVRTRAERRRFVKARDKRVGRVLKEAKDEL